MNDEIQRIISGESKVRFGTTIQTVLCYLAGSKTASSMAKTSKHYKKQETEELIRYIESRQLWVNVDIDCYISEGAEQKAKLSNQTKRWNFIFHRYCILY